MSAIDLKKGMHPLKNMIDEKHGIIMTNKPRAKGEKAIETYLTGCLKSYFESKEYEM
jgi:hypothetical protein